MAALGINLGFLLFQIFNFLIVMVLLYAWAYKPIINGLKKRQENIAKGIEDAQVAAEARMQCRRGSPPDHRQSPGRGGRKGA